MMNYTPKINEAHINVKKNKRKQTTQKLQQNEKNESFSTDLYFSVTKLMKSHLFCSD